LYDEDYDSQKQKQFVLPLAVMKWGSNKTLAAEIVPRLKTGAFSEGRIRVFRVLKNRDIQLAKTHNIPTRDLGTCYSRIRTGMAFSSSTKSQRLATKIRGLVRGCSELNPLFSNVTSILHALGDFEVRLERLCTDEENEHSVCCSYRGIDAHIEDVPHDHIEVKTLMYDGVPGTFHVNTEDETYTEQDLRVSWAYKKLAIENQGTWKTPPSGLRLDRSDTHTDTATLAGLPTVATPLVGLVFPSEFHSQMKLTFLGDGLCLADAFANLLPEFVNLEMVGLLVNAVQSGRVRMADFMHDATGIMSRTTQFRISDQRKDGCLVNMRDIGLVAANQTRFAFLCNMARDHAASNLNESRHFLVRSLKHTCHASDYCY
jgi:hypothetical protein